MLKVAPDTGQRDQDGGRQRERTGNDQWHNVTAGSAVQQSRTYGAR
jgi:hypothetical protein